MGMEVTPPSLGLLRFLEGSNSNHFNGKNSNKELKNLKEVVNGYQF